MAAQIIILNGLGSVGKSSTARALQVLTREPFLHVAMDAFIDMMPSRMLGDPHGLLFEPTIEQGMPSIAIRTGGVFERVMADMRHAIAAMACNGNNIVVDEVMLWGGAHEYRRHLTDFSPRFVGLFDPSMYLNSASASVGTGWLD